MVSQNPHNPRIPLTFNQPPKVSDQKRKRGRPPGASKVEQDASNSKSPVTNDEPDAEEEARPRKRGRKPNAEKLNTAADLAARDGPAPPAKRGRPPKTSEPTSARDAEAQSERQGKDTGRQPGGSSNKGISTSKGKQKESQSHGTQADEEASSSEPRRSGRERRSWNPDEIFGSNSTTSADHKIPYRGQKDGSRKATGATKDNAEVVQSRGKGKAVQSKESRAEDEPSGALRRRRTREHPEPTIRAQISPDEGVSSKTQKQGRGAAKGQDAVPKRGRPALGKEDRLRLQARRRNKPSTQKAMAHNQGDVVVPKHQAAHPQLQGKTSHQTLVPRLEAGHPNPVKTKAKLLPKRHGSKHKPGGRTLFPRKQKVRSQRKNPSYLFGTSEKPRKTSPEPLYLTNGIPSTARPSTLSGPSWPTRNALSFSVSKTPTEGVSTHPPTAGAPTQAGSGSYEDEFDFERTVDAIQALENTLNPLQHSVALLEREIRREEDALAKDYDSLHKLEANARSEAKRWREQARREHVLAPGVKRKGEGGDEEPRDSLELVPRSEDDAPGGLFEGLQDEELVTISKQVGSHMESMKGNLQQIGGVVPAIAKSKAALQQVLLRHLDDEQYERVLVG
ncbi:hypothetical protein VSDG_03270 [Cytospora chrysosperma]|uniref:Uncharacterized protein n=1 Tax=Cytospora chrysosperma TaxID=252740 RepID=A0A423WB54_CYTCH|nr:hypothetical protein VSDG_03270 [Valsa sordida]